MKNTTRQDAYNELQKIVADYPNGITASAIADNLAQPIPQRTLQYRLKQLVGNGQLRMVGSGRWAKYHPAAEYETAIDPASRQYTEAAAQPAQADTPPTVVGENTNQYRDYSHLIGLSAAGKAVRDYVQQPTAARKPVGYDRDFLDRYEPNTTFYLTEQERKRLRETGEQQPVPQPAGTYARHILNRLLIDLSWNSSRLEGSTYSLLDTRRLIEFGREAGGDQVEAQMILNHKDAIEFLVEAAADIDFNKYTMLNLHALLSNNLLPDPKAPGRLRLTAVGIGHSVFLPLENPHLIKECFEQVLRNAAAIQDPFEQAFFIMVHLPYLQPFDDVNKRVSRLAANIPLIRNNLAPLSFTDVPRCAYTDAILGIYEANDVALLRDVFCHAYGRSAAQYAAVQQTIGEPDTFRLQYRDELREIIAMLIRTGTGRKQVIDEVAQWASRRIEDKDRDRFIETVEEELIGLHEGNFARYQVRPAEFASWWELWNSR